MQLLIFSIFLLLQNFHFAENDCIPPSIPTRDKHGFDCCKLPPEPFPHKAIYEEFCSPVYFGVMEEHPNGRFCRLSSTQYRKSIPCESGWVMFYEGYNQFCYKAFTITSSKDAIDISSKKSDPCQNKHKRASLVRVPNENINMFLFVKVLNGALNLSCSTTDANTYYYYIGLHRNDFNWQWRPYHEKSYSHLEEQAQQLLDYLNSPHSQHIWSDGTRIFADGWDNANDITTNVVISNC
ncbi:unnamed protein product [Cercopithifilaria johnstoni]|uniref:Uncharacterized protein n=1 Tax=Cercopithifilaria johnstoni TaxID=2874296 RepID=A0A8J2M1C8_9BILA|nr:unnamed protein product [Cercopithifilaria johnstoni]